MAVESLRERAARRENRQAALAYERVARAIAFLQAHHREQPDLAAVARAAHLSPHHFQRVFTRWAGISPKRFLQFLTLEHARQRLAAATAVLDAALDAGLSGPGRLHDLFVSLEAVTPGEFKTRGAGLVIRYGWHETPFGVCLLGVTARGVCWLSFAEDWSGRAAVREMQAHWSGAMWVEAPAATAPVAARIFSRAHRAGPAPLSVLVRGTNFQLQVWRALLRVPAGAVVTYRGLGELLGVPRAARAVGGAVGDNPVAWLIPCHRVIRADGAPGGYRWGSPRKQAMLAWEAARAGAASGESRGRNGNARQRGPACVG
jgi:AraC family transcriptional regulator of adaptative response/methylated-DNA-[protein]-cysteine methyltransferase